jgi:hypothetical protein
MPSFEQVAQWLRATRPGWRHIEDRIADIRFAYRIDTQPDAVLDGDPSAMTVGNGPAYVLKRTGEAWFLPSIPALLPVHDARTERGFRKRMAAAGMGDAQEVVGTHTPTLTAAAVATWLRTVRPEWRHVEDRIADIGYAFRIDTQPDAFLDGDDSAMTDGNGPAFVLKRTGEAWFLPSTYDMLPAFDARAEHEFRAVVDFPPHHVLTVS